MNEAHLPIGLPAKAAFAPFAVTHLDSASVHPMSRGASRAIEAYLRSRRLEPGASDFGLDVISQRVRAKFAELIRAEAGEISLVQSTTSGENLVLQALGIPAVGGRIVTDTLHYPGSIHLYQSMARAGMEVRWLRPRGDGSLCLNDFEAAISRDTRLVALSLVSAVNGFQHDVKQICEIAHARGAHVYADIVQAAGAVPIDVRRCDLDFAACASYKWLMGDFGLGFLFVRGELLPRIRCTQFGPAQVLDMRTHLFPFDPPGEGIAQIVPRRDATGHFATGTTCATVAAQLDYSLDFIKEVGVINIQRYRQPLLDAARNELDRRGYSCMTPRGTTSPILSFAYPNASTLRPRLDAQNVKITLVDNRFRIAVSVFNDSQDIENLLAALP